MLKYWSGLNAMKCDVCRKTCTEQFSDIKTFAGPWAIACDDCVPRVSIAKHDYYGTGRGQRYTRQPDLRWLKTS